MDNRHTTIIDKYLNNFTIAIDLDATLTPTFSEEWFKQYHLAGGEYVDVSTVNTYDVKEHIKNPELMYSLLKPEACHWMETLPIANNAYETVKWLNNVSSVYIVTATPLEDMAVKIRWINKNLPFINPSQIISLKDKHLFDADFLLDDSAEQISNFIQRGIVTGRYKIGLLFSQPWNAYLYDEVMDMTMEGREYDWVNRIGFVDCFDSTEHINVNVFDEINIDADSVVSSIRRFIYDTLGKLSVDCLEMDRVNKVNNVLH